MPKVSIIIPIYKAEKYIKKCAISLFEQSLEDIEYIFVDDCTPDDSINLLLKIIERYPQRKENIKLIRLNENSGQSAARNTGLDVVSGDYVIHCDPDDWVDKDFYSNLYQTAITNNADVVLSDYLIHCEDGSEILIKNKDFKTPLEPFFSNSFFFPSLWSLFVKKELIVENSLSFFRGINFMEDYGFIARVLYYAKSIVNNHLSLYHYYKGNEEAITKKINSKPIIAQRIQCLNLVDNFFESKGISRNKLGLSLRSKRDIKDLSLSQMRLKEWKDLFPEVAIWELKNSEASFIYRLIYYLSHKIGVWPMKLLLRFKK